MLRHFMEEVGSSWPEGGEEISWFGFGLMVIFLISLVLGFPVAGTV